MWVAGQPQPLFAAGLRFDPRRDPLQGRLTGVTWGTHGLGVGVVDLAAASGHVSNVIQLSCSTDAKTWVAEATDVAVAAQDAGALGLMTCRAGALPGTSAPAHARP